MCMCMAVFPTNNLKRLSFDIDVAYSECFD